jgi:hypothetical protein
MDEADERVLKILDEFARAPREVGPLALSEEYLAAVARVESLPENQSGADKTSRDAAQTEFLSHYRRVQRP